MSWEAYVNLAFHEIRMAGAGSPQVSRRLKAALVDLKTVAPAERREVLDEHLDLLESAVRAALSDEREIALGLQEDRAGIRIAAGANGP